MSATVSRMYLYSVLNLRNALRREEGQTMTEYGVLLALIAVIVIASLLVLGPKIADVFTLLPGSSKPGAGHPFLTAAEGRCTKWRFVIGSSWLASSFAAKRVRR